MIINHFYLILLAFLISSCAATYMEKSVSSEHMVAFALGQSSIEHCKREPPRYDDVARLCPVSTVENCSRIEGGSLSEAFVAVVTGVTAYVVGLF